MIGYFKESYEGQEDHSDIMGFDEQDNENDDTTTGTFLQDHCYSNSTTGRSTTPTSAINPTLTDDQCGQAGQIESKYGKQRVQL